jgi:hypothetical protein
MFGLPALPLDAFPFVVFALGTAGLVAAKIWSWNLDRMERLPAGSAEPKPISPAAPQPIRSADKPVSEINDEAQHVRSFTVGMMTFVVFPDGTIEARTEEGTKRFGSMDEVRTYLERAII